MAVSDDVKLHIYNRALLIMEGRQLSSISEDRESRRVLDVAYGANGEGVTACLEKADWNFAARAMKLEHDPNLETSFSYQYAFAKPSDTVRLTSLSADEYFNHPLVASQYLDESGYWFSDITPLYAKIVSNHTDYGFNSGAWPESFKDLLSAWLAKMCWNRITGDRRAGVVAEQAYRDALKHAKSRDAMDEGTKFPTPGAWIRARSSGSSRFLRRDEY